MAITVEGKTELNGTMCWGLQKLLENSDKKDQFNDMTKSV